MHHVDFAEVLIREIDEKAASTEANMLNGLVQDWVGYQKLTARRAALLEVRGIITHALGRDETRL